jgi:hypothetical protein
MPGFRHPAVFFLTRHPFFFLALSFFEFCFLDATVVDPVAKEAVEPAKNIRPAMSAIMTTTVLCIIVPFRLLVSWGS